MLLLRTLVRICFTSTSLAEYSSRRNFTLKKNKTWTDDGLLSVTGGYAVLHNNTGKVLGRIPVSQPLLSGSTLSVAGKDVEVDRCITKSEYVALITPHRTSEEEIRRRGNVQTQRQQDFVPPRANQSVQGQMKDAISRWKKKDGHNTSNSEERHIPRPATFQQALAEKTALSRAPREIPIPRHDPDAPGALVFATPKHPAQGRQTVDVVLDPLIGQRLREHQREGVKFLYECVMGLRNFDGRGCILADEMGLGKTLTTIALLWTLLTQNPVYKAPPVVQKALIVCPVSLIRNWKREFRKWLGERVGVLEFDDNNTRLSAFDGKVYRVMIIGYERLRMVADDLVKGLPIDIVICDEGHRLKTMKNKSAQAIESLNTPRRIILSGTPIQNDLGEFFAMVNFVNDGCLGSQRAFLKDFEAPIMKSRQPNASEDDIERGEEASEELARITSPFILRRTADILLDFLPAKTEYVLFCRPTSEQAKVYRHVLKSPMFHRALRSHDAAFQMITILKKICNSPALMNPMVGKDDSSTSGSLTTLNEMLPPGLAKYYHNSCSSKIRILDELLQQIRHTTDEKIVLVSNYTSTLDIIENLLANSNLKYVRLDGTVPAKKRQGMVDEFNRAKSSHLFAFLLSAKAGGVGINLIGASRLVLFDVDWNPATEDQAVARIHRQGQTRPCKIYRFLLKGAIEERIWQRQVVKRALADSIMEGGSLTVSGLGDAPMRGKSAKATFSQEELRDLFTLDDSTRLRTHDLVGCQCQCNGAGPDPASDESGTDLNNTPFDDDIPDHSQGEPAEELPDVSNLVRASPLAADKNESQERNQTAGSHAKQTGSEVKQQTAQLEELMRYVHLDTSSIPQLADGSVDLAQMEAVLDDPCLLHVLRQGEDTVAGGVSFLFKRGRAQVDDAFSPALQRGDQLTFD